MRTLPIDLTLTLTLTLVLASPAAAAGLEYAQAVANGLSEVGETVLADERIDLSVSRPSASARVDGTMSHLFIHSGTTINKSQDQISAVAQAQAEFTDAVTVTAPGVPPGAPLTLRLAFSISGSADIQTSSRILCSARITAVGPNKQRWEKTEANNGIPTITDANGVVVFEIPVVEGDPTQSDVLVAFITESVCGLPGSNVFSYYDSQATSSLSVTFLPSSTSLVDDRGNVLPIWSIESESMLDYGVGDSQAILSEPAPMLTTPAEAPDTIRVSWRTNELESYTLESSPDLITWSPEATVTGDDLNATIDLPKPAGRHFYRLVSQFTPGGETSNP